MSCTLTSRCKPLKKRLTKAQIKRRNRKIEERRLRRWEQ